MGHIKPQLQPHVYRPDHAVKADHILLAHHTDDAPKRLRMGQINHFQNDLSQPFLPLGGQEQLFDKRPGVRSVAVEQGADQVAANLSLGMLTAADFQQGLINRFPAFITDIDGRRQEHRRG